MALDSHPPRDGDTLDRIMAEMPDWHSEFARTYANHAPMVLVALDRIGANADRLRDFFEHYRVAKGLFAPPPRVAPLDAATWETAIGQRERETDLRDFFAGEVGRLGIPGALQAYLPRLSPGVGASAFHALMRLAYALLRADAREVGISLAYWSACWLTMPRATGAAPLTRDPAEILARVSRIAPLRDLPTHELLWQNMTEVGKVPAFAPVVDWLEVDDQTTARLAGASIALFAATQDFCALHAVTGVHWLRLVLPHCPTPETLQRHFWQGIAALMGEMGFPALPSAEALEAWRRLPVPSWEEINAAARLSNDEHDVSITFSCQEEMKIYGDPLYQLAAARRVGLVADYT